MPQGKHAGLLYRLVQLLRARAGDGSSDGRLLERFAVGRDETAFMTLVARHGGMVLGICRRVLGHEQDAEDAFQATFLLLARKAAAIRKKESVASWLHGVAFRVAVRARSAAAKRQY